MPTISGSNVPPPKSWDEFEDIALSAGKLRWRSTELSRNGRPGQVQHGVDILGYDAQKRHIGVQCKNTIDGVSEAVVNAEIKLAEAFQPPLDALYIATTAKRDAKIQKTIRLISAERVKRGKFPVAILFWDDIHQDLATNSDVFFKHYPQYQRPIDHVAKIRQKRRLMMAPPPPVDFIERPVEFEALKERLLIAKGDAPANAERLESASGCGETMLAPGPALVALRGAGGYGKTTLAKALAHDPEIQATYCDGVLWIELGEKPNNLVSIISDLVALLTGERPALDSISATASALEQALADQHILMVIDDVWHEKDLVPFLQGGCNTTRLVTTRVDDVLPINSWRRQLRAMGREESLRLLCWDLPVEQVHLLGPQLAKLASRLGDWPLLLKLVGAFLRTRVARSGEPLDRAVSGVNDRLRIRGLRAFDAVDENETNRAKAVAATLEVGLDAVRHETRARYTELCIFPEDTDIPVDVAAQLWAETAGLDELQAEDTLAEFYNLSLLLELDLSRRTFRMHDTLRAYIGSLLSAAELRTLHKRFADVLQAALVGNRKLEPSYREYLYSFLPLHFYDGGDPNSIFALLTDPTWIRDKLSVVNDPLSLVFDYEHFGQTQEELLIGQTIRLISGILRRDKEQLFPQLMGRLRAQDSPNISKFLRDVRCLIPRPGLVPVRATLTTEGAEVIRLEGHNKRVWTLALLPDGRLASAGSDKSISIWNSNTWAEEVKLNEFDRRYEILKIIHIPGDRLVSVGGENFIRVWDLSSLQDHVLSLAQDDRVMSAAYLGEEKLAVSCMDSIRILSIDNPNSQIILPDSRHIDGIATLSSGFLAGYSKYSGEVRIWNSDTHDLHSKIELESARSIDAIEELMDGSLAISAENTLRIWDIGSLTERSRFTTELGYLGAIAELPTGEIATARGNSILLWDRANGNVSRRLDGHRHWISSIIVTQKGYLASTGGDGTVRIWSPQNAQRIADVASGEPIRQLCVFGEEGLVANEGKAGITFRNASDGVVVNRLSVSENPALAMDRLGEHFLIVGDDGGSIHILDVRAKSTTRSYRVSGEPITAVVSMSPDLCACAGNDDIIRIWDCATGIELGAMENAQLLAPLGEILLSSNYRAEIAIVPTDNGHLAAAGNDGTIRLWSLKTGRLAANLKGHKGPVLDLVKGGDGLLISAGRDGTVRLWNVSGRRRRPIACLEGHKGSVQVLCVLSNRLILSAGEDCVVIVWDLDSHLKHASIELDFTIESAVVTHDNVIILGDSLGRLHWLAVVE